MLPTIEVGLFIQNGGWVFIGVPVGSGFYREPLFSGKRGSLQQAIDAAKKLAPAGSPMVYSRLESNLSDGSIS